MRKVKKYMDRARGLAEDFMDEWLCYMDHLDDDGDDDDDDDDDEEDD